MLFTKAKHLAIEEWDISDEDLARILREAWLKDCRRRFMEEADEKFH